MAISKDHPGFKAVEKSIAKREGLPQKAAGAILASQTRKASPKAVAANPRLGKVKGIARGEDSKSAAIGRRLGKMREPKDRKRGPFAKNNSND